MITNQLPNGLTLLQQNPDCAVDFNGGVNHGWLFVRHYPGGTWVSQRKLVGAELDQAWDQAVDGFVQQGTKVREG